MSSSGEGGGQAAGEAGVGVVFGVVADGQRVARVQEQVVQGGGNLVDVGILRKRADPVVDDTWVLAAV